MSQLMTRTDRPHRPAARHADFSDLVAELEFELGPVDAWQRRGLEWAALADRLRSLGHVISIGGPL